MKLRLLHLVFATTVCVPLCAAAQVSARDGAGAAEARRAALPALRLVVQLASDVSADEIKARDDAITLLNDELILAGGERVLAQNFLYAASEAAPTGTFTSLVASEGKQPGDYVRAARESYARFRAAEQGAQHEWMAKQVTAARKYAGRAAEALIAEAKTDEQQATKLQTEPFAVRRSPERVAAFVAELKANGLGAEHRKFALEGGYQEGELDAFLKELLATPPEELGASMVELYTETANTRRTLAASLKEFSEVAADVMAGPRSQTFVVGNPHDQDETVDLTIRRISIPVDWELSIVNAPLPEPSTPPAAGQKKADPPPVSEFRPGRHYQVSLPAKTEVRVAVVVVPVGETGENTTARWAVEGRIGNELLGGVVHEMHVPAMLADLQLPPIGAAATPAAGFAAGAPGFRSPLVWLAAAILVLLAGILVVVWRRKRSRA